MFYVHSLSELKARELNLSVLDSVLTDQGGSPGRGWCWLRLLHLLPPGSALAPPSQTSLLLLRQRWTKIKLNTSWLYVQTNSTAYVIHRSNSKYYDLMFFHRTSSHSSWQTSNSKWQIQYNITKVSVSECRPRYLPRPTVH